ncbi:serine/threonine-protein kinase [Actinophytocola oryzae]|uniref:non-specific serine/threonine protein kinase n=1 Tax=Actinophytocola oryzae TaxID=502181 RepID=A0A4R7UYT7_9PSEU|nr:serine/threonine-protein kinase [Actinophytocola oryzae]TDV41364.1 serine/threonine protein kinase [Actinophytocola oryzae]
MTAEGALVAGRYRLGRQIGSGAMGIVWQAHDERLHRTVAVKQLLLQPGLSAAQAEEARRRCMREGRIAARLTHPNAITVYDVAEHDGDPWLIMEYLPSKSLATVLSEQGTLPVSETARIGAQVAAALVAAHAAGIVHRDIKPANVLLGEDGTVKITDFGISRATGDVTVTATGMLAGTPAYLAPEVAKGEDPKPAADVFSLGSTLYTAIEGHSPFGLSENTLALLYAVAAGKITPPRQAGPLTALLMQLLRVEPGERPSLSTTKDNLQAVAEGRTPSGVLNAAGAPTDRIAGNRLPSRPAGPPPQQQPQQRWGAPQGPPSPPEGTRLDVHPFSEPTPSGPVREQLQTQQPSSRPGANKARNDRVRSIVLTVLAIVAAALIGILVASLLSNDDSDDSAGQGPQSSKTSTTLTSSKSTAPTTTTTTETTTTTTTTEKPPAGPTPAEYEQTVRDYYGLLPGNVEGAWQRMTPTAQAAGGGQDAYQSFWAGIASVQVLSATVSGNQVTTALQFVTTDNRTSNESYLLMIVGQPGALMIDNFQKLG